MVELLLLLPLLPLFVELFELLLSAFELLPLDDPEPVLITRCTVLPGSSAVPLVGVWLMTLPCETEVLDWYSVVTVKPRLFNVVVAEPSD